MSDGLHYCILAPYKLCTKNESKEEKVSFHLVVVSHGEHGEYMECTEIVSHGVH
jgi:hypothetical protein